MTTHPNRSRRTKTVRLTPDEANIALACVRIAAEDGSIFGGWVPGEREYDERISDLEAIEAALKTALN